MPIVNFFKPEFLKMPWEELLGSANYFTGFMEKINFSNFTVIKFNSSWNQTIVKNLTTCLCKKKVLNVCRNED